MLEKRPYWIIGGGKEFSPRTAVTAKPDDGRNPIMAINNPAERSLCFRFLYLNMRDHFRKRLRSGDEQI